MLCWAGAPGGRHRRPGGPGPRHSPGSGSPPASGPGPGVVPGAPSLRLCSPSLLDTLFQLKVRIAVGSSVSHHVPPFRWPVPEDR